MLTILFQKAESLVSFTTDIWTNASGSPYNCLTGTYLIREMDGRLKMVTRLLGFQRLKGTHSSKRIAAVCVAQMKRVGAHNKVCDFWVHYYKLNEPI